MKVLAIDFGTKRVGVAVGDTELKIALPKETLPNDDELINRIENIVKSGNVGKILVGLPLTPSGKEGERAKMVRAFVSVLKEQLPETEIELWDERYTTIEAQGRLRELPPRKRKGLIDSVSAQIILEEYLRSL